MWYITMAARFKFYPYKGNLIIRLMVGLVFLSEGIQKLLFEQQLGAGRFAKIGIPHPGFFGPFVGSTEIICSVLLLIGFYTRMATLPLLAVILTAIGTTKIPMLFAKGFWAAAHEGRADICMLLGLIFLVVYGSGLYSADVPSYYKK